MHSYWVRANAVVFFGISVLGFFSVLCAWSTSFHQPTPVLTKLRINSLRDLKPLRMRYAKRNMDRAMFTFDLEADLSSVFDWNVKQIFVYVTANYSTPSNKENEVVIWDKIIQTADDAKIVEHNTLNKYNLIDQYDELRGSTVDLSLRWDVMPITGILYMDRRFPNDDQRSVELPSTYS